MISGGKDVNSTNNRLLQYLIHENVDPVYPKQIIRREPSVIIKVVGEPETPHKGTLDPEIIYCVRRITLYR